jgi:diguanylate cyclase (GGDEF)-like protein
MTPPTNRELGETIRSRLATAVAEAGAGGGQILPGTGPRPDLSVLIRRLSDGASGLDYVYWCLEHLALRFELDDAILVVDQPELGHQIFRLRQRSIADAIEDPMLRQSGLHTRPDLLSEDDKATIVALCQSALSLALARHDAAHDSLTGLLNRRSFEDAIGQFVANAERHGTNFCLALLDVDGLKQVNDLTGHWRGDRLLQASGRELDRLMRAGEIAARLGGDEFGLLLVGSDTSGVSRIRDRLEAAVSGHMGMPTRYSVGVATTAEAGFESAALYRLADARLYEEKRSGRGHPVVMVDEDAPRSRADQGPDQGTEERPAPGLLDGPSVGDLNRLELRLRRWSSVVWARVAPVASGGLHVQVAASREDRSWRERAISELQSETGGPVGLQVLDFDHHGHGPGTRPNRVKLESVRRRLQYMPGAEPVPGIEVQLSHAGRRGTGFSWDVAPGAAVNATMAALADLGVGTPYEIESVTRLGFSSSAPVLTVLRLLGTGENRMGVARRADAFDAAARAFLAAANRDLERELEGLVAVDPAPV